MANLAVPIPYQWQVGDIGSASLLNAQLYNGLTFLLNPPVFFGYQNTVQSLGTSDTAVSIDQTVFDTYSGHSNTTNNSRYVGPVPGYYLVSGCVAFSANTTGARQAKVKKNGANIQGGSAQVGASGSGLTTVTSPVVYVYLNGTTDYVEIYAWQSSGSALNSSINPDQACSMSVRWVHA